MNFKASVTVTNDLIKKFGNPRSVEILDYVRKRIAHELYEQIARDIANKATLEIFYDSLMNWDIYQINIDFTWEDLNQK